ncbi:MAG TPA: exodeoxyribonuclease VII large subunit, partial [Saprospiraceae bacterium]|nr:exodeoxyribonuclease VII large subunit [Saprospiraceae bacterium]
LERTEQALRFLPLQRIQKQQLRLDSLANEIPRWYRQRAKTEHQRLSQLEQLMSLISPEATLKRGFSIVLKEGKTIASASELKAGEQFTARFRDGEITGEVKKQYTSSKESEYED